MLRGHVQAHGEREGECKGEDDGHGLHGGSHLDGRGN
jgi:hypothetical protein